MGDRGDAAPKTVLKKLISKKEELSQGDTVGACRGKRCALSV
jgi:hypothetical protein